MRRFNEFFRFDPHAHFVAFVVHMAALFEKRRHHKPAELVEGDEDSQPNSSTRRRRGRPSYLDSLFSFRSYALPWQHGAN
jgi:hypothetical protein